ncbi:hypothetical protein AAEX28_10900 [Lentisphaerota bacterium WC36G]|nr:hypothetical protein LJT99_13740 [Lentisphaerae bacterium WC36]
MTNSKSYLIRKCLVVFGVALTFNLSGCLWFAEDKYPLVAVSLDKKQLKSVDERTDEIANEIALTKEQKIKVNGYVKLYAEKILAIRKSSYSATIKIKLAKQAIDEFETLLKGALNSKQFATYIEIKKARFLHYYQSEQKKTLKKY